MQVPMRLQDPGGRTKSLLSLADHNRAVSRGAHQVGLLLRPFVNLPFHLVLFENDMSR